MSLRARGVLYLVALHLALGTMGVLLARQHRAWLLVTEAALVASLLAAVALGRRLMEPLALARESAQLLAENDYSTRFRAVGQPDVDALVGVYNRLADSLRDERVRLQEQHQFLARLLDVSPSGILILDLDGGVAVANPAATRLAGASPVGLTRVAEVPVVGEALAALGAGESQVVPLWGGRRLKCHHGTFLDRGFTRSFYTVDELTQELRHQEREAWEKIVRTLSHEVNNSVTAAGSLLHSCLHYGAQLAEEDRGDFEQALTVVIGRTEQLAAFMRACAEVVRLPPPRLAPCDLSDIVASVAVLQRGAAPEVAWTVDAPRPGPVVPVDRAQMEQALVNVVKNAVEAAGPAGAVSVRVEPRGARTAVVVEDSGRGIAPEAQGQLFTPFFSTKEKGQGLGLALVQEVLAQHRCEFSLEGPEGGPTRFTIVFPG